MRFSFDRPSTPKPNAEAEKLEHAPNPESPEAHEVVIMRSLEDIRTTLEHILTELYPDTYVKFEEALNSQETYGPDTRIVIMPHERAIALVTAIGVRLLTASLAQDRKGIWKTAITRNSEEDDTEIARLLFMETAKPIADRLNNKRKLSTNDIEAEIEELKYEISDGVETFCQRYAAERGVRYAAARSRAIRTAELAIAQSDPNDENSTEQEEALRLSLREELMALAQLRDTQPEAIRASLATLEST